MINYRPEELDQRLKFRSQSAISDGQGGRVMTWIDNFECWGKVKVQNGNERENYDQLESFGRYKFVIRWRDDFSETNLIIWNNQEYNIKFIEKLGGRKLYLVVTAERGVAQ